MQRTWSFYNFKVGYLFHFILEIMCLPLISVIVLNFMLYVYSMLLLSWTMRSKEIKSLYSFSGCALANRTDERIKKGFIIALDRKAKHAVTTQLRVGISDSYFSSCVEAVSD